MSFSFIFIRLFDAPTSLIDHYRIILDKFQILSTETKGLFFVDQELKRIAQSRDR